MSQKIQKIKAREILDSRGNPTLEVEAYLEGQVSLRASVPSGSSTGAHEALELRDNDPKRFNGLGVKKACALIEERVAPIATRMDPCDLHAIDAKLLELDGTENKSRLGANTTLAVSLVMAKVGAALRGLPLYKHIAQLYGHQGKLKIPTPFLNLINGGRHANNSLNIQEFMIVPEGFVSFKEAVRASSEIFQQLKRTLKLQGDTAAVGDEGGFAPSAIKNPQEAMDTLVLAIEKAGYKSQVTLALDLAASEFFDPPTYLSTNKADLRSADRWGGRYQLFKGEASLTASQVIENLRAWRKSYPLISLEDPLAEDDWSGWALLTKELKNVLLVGDDLFVTNPRRFKQGLDQHVANSILIKPNQIGTLTETAQTVRLAKKNGYATIASHRSGETEDASLAHIAVGLGTDGIKSGSLSRSERLAKYNELLRIEEELGPQTYRGKLRL